jgi:YidC/Oxa1 family membrane protein insertase
MLTFFVRIITAPLTYSSYLSGAKMKVLRPELDALKAKFPEQQTYAMEQMKLFREAGVNPLGGCIPVLVQLPVFVALYSFFNSNIAVRGHSFLWASDLSLYDSIVHFSFNIPFLGDHISLFTILAVAGQFVLSIYNLSMTPQSNDPSMAMMKYMPYIFPFFMFFIFNSLPSALTWYYTVSNLTIIIQQIIIQRFIIDHNKILARLNEKRKQPKKKSKWQERMEQIQESQKKMQELKNKAPLRPPNRGK